MEAVVQSKARGFGPLYVASYAWASAVSFGLVLTDVGYAAMLRSAVDPAVTAGLFSRMADFFVFTSAVTLLAALGALAAAWESRAARNLIVAGLVLGISAIFGPSVLPEDVLREAGSAVRLLIGGGTSVLAMLALHQVQRSR